MKLRTIMLTFALLFVTSCASQVLPPDASFLRFSRGTYGARVLQWIGLAAEGDYCMLSSSELNYVFTVDDVEFFKQQCPPDTEIGRLMQAMTINR